MSTGKSMQFVTKTAIQGPIPITNIAIAGAHCGLRIFKERNMANLLIAKIQRIKTTKLIMHHMEYSGFSRKTQEIMPSPVNAKHGAQSAPTMARK